MEVYLVTKDSRKYFSYCYPLGDDCQFEQLSSCASEDIPGARLIQTRLDTTWLKSRWERALIHMWDLKGFYHKKVDCLVRPTHWFPEGYILVSITIHRRRAWGRTICLNRLLGLNSEFMLSPDNRDGFVPNLIDRPWLEDLKRYMVY